MNNFRPRKELINKILVIKGKTPLKEVRRIRRRLEALGIQNASSVFSRQYDIYFLIKERYIRIVYGLYYGPYYNQADTIHPEELKNYQATYISNKPKFRSKAWMLVREGWTQHSLARDRNDNELTSVESPIACRFCASGAIQKAYKNTYDSSLKIIQLRNHLFDNYGIESIITWNDCPGQTKEEVINTLKALDI